MIFALQEVTLFGVAAAVSSLVGCILAVASYIANRKNAAEKANEDMHQELISLREQNEALSKELHDFKLRRLPDE